MSVLLKAFNEDRQECLSYYAPQRKGQTGMSVLLIMAIGWGKSFEEQVEEANQRASQERAPRVPTEDRVRLQRLASIKLSRSRIEEQLGKAVQPAHREMLMKALRALEKEVEEISQAGNSKQP